MIDAASPRADHKQGCPNAADENMPCTCGFIPTESEKDSTIRALEGEIERLTKALDKANRDLAFVSSHSNMRPEP